MLTTQIWSNHGNIPHGFGKLFTNIEGHMEKTERKTDRRVIKTKRAIRNALATLLTEKDYNDITIKDIADTADINRKTFYNYYRGVYQVVEEIENELVGKLDIIFGDINFKSYVEDPSNMLKKMNAVMNEDLEFYEHLFSIKDGTTLMQKVVDTLKQKTKENFLRQVKGVDESHVDILLDFILTGTIAVYHQWFNSDRTRSLDEVSSLVGNLAANGVSAFIKEHLA